MRRILGRDGNPSAPRRRLASLYWRTPAPRINRDNDRLRQSGHRFAKPGPVQQIENAITNEFNARLPPLLRRLRPHWNTGGDLLQIANDDLVAGPHSLVNDHQLALVGTG
jgi:hypothetical protein